MRRLKKKTKKKSKIQSKTIRRPTQTQKKTRGLLGRFLLLRLSQKRRKKAVRALSQRTPKKKTRTQGLGFLSETLGHIKTPEVPIVLTQELVPIAAPAPPVAITEVAPQTYDSSTGPRWLLTNELLRPGDELRQSIEGFLLDQRSPHTRRAYGKDLKRFIQFLLTRKEERGVEKIDRLLIIAYKDSLLNEGLEHTTVDRHLATLRSFFRWLVDDGKVERSPVEGVRFINPKRMSSTLGFTDEEVRRVLSVPDRHTQTGAMHHAILSVLFYCGLRRSELCSLRTTNVGTERNHPVIRLRGKGNAERLIVIPPRAWASLNHYLAISRKELKEDQVLFNPVKNNRGGGILDKPLNPSTIFYIVTKYSKLAGIVNRVSPHSCRATAISNARDHQVSDRAIQEFAGWASPDMITRYDKRKNAIENSASLAIRYETETKSDHNSSE